MRKRALFVGLVAAAALQAGGIASADGPLPGSGYTFDNYYCGGGTIADNSWCGDGSNHSYGWNSADYDGGGNVEVCARVIDSSNALKFDGCSTNLIRTCWNLGSGCDDQDTYTNWRAQVKHQFSGGARHTITGHGKA